MYHRLKSFLDINKILFKAQHGFREKYSTQHAILDTVNIIQNNMDTIQNYSLVGSLLI